MARFYNYRVCTHYNNYDIEISSDDIYFVLEKFEASYTAGFNVDIIDGGTGEIYASVNNSEENENFMKDEFALLYKGWKFDTLVKSLE